VTPRLNVTAAPIFGGLRASPARPVRLTFRMRMGTDWSSMITSAVSNTLMRLLERLLTSSDMLKPSWAAQHLMCGLVAG
jgi:hypothetical protein